jgi:chorismate--pyruvate lyase
MVPLATGQATKPSSTAAVAWLPLESLSSRAPVDLLPWLEEPGLLTARVRAVCGDATQFRMLHLRSAPLAPELQVRLGVADATCLLREIEFSCVGVRWVFAQSAFPHSTVERYPWLRDLGESPLGEALRRVPGMERDAFEYAELPADHDLARDAEPSVTSTLWARRAVYRLAGAPLVVQEVFLPGLGRWGKQEER